MTNSVALFGGAIWCAGLVAPVVGQEFVPVYAAGVYTYAVVDSSYFGVTDAAAAYTGPDFDAASAAAVDTAIGFATTGVTSTALIVDTDVLGGQGGASIGGLLSVSGDAIAFLTWDFDETSIDSRVRIVDTTVSSSVVFETDALTSSTASVALLADRTYSVSIRAVTGPSTSTSAAAGFASIVLVPAPGASAVVIGLVGLAAARRRRS